MTFPQSFFTIHATGRWEADFLKSQSTVQSKAMRSTTTCLAKSVATTPQRHTLQVAAQSTSLTRRSTPVVKQIGTDFSGDVGRSLMYDSPQRSIQREVRGIMGVVTPARPAKGDAPSAKKWSLVSPQELEKKRGPCLAEFHPGIAGGWVTASHRLVNIHTELPTSRRTVWWRCAHCASTFQRKIVEHVEMNGQCPSCEQCPSVHQEYAPLPKNLRFRRLTNRKELWSQHCARIRQSVVDMHQEELTEKRMDLHSKPRRQKRGHAVPPLGARNLQPMLAHMWQRYRHTIPRKEQLTVSPKLDGVRCVAAWDPKRKQVVLISRHGTIIQSCPHINQALHNFFDNDPFLVLDGELYHHTAFETFEELSGLIRRTKSSGLRGVSAKEAQKLKSIEFHIFDVMESMKPAVKNRLRKRKTSAGRTSTRSRPVNVGELPFTARLRFLHDTFAPAHETHSRPSPSVAGCPSCIKIVSAMPCGIDRVDRYLRLFISKGYEGVMIRRVSHPYAKGKRSSYLLKYKNTLDDEYRIHGVVEGQGKWKHALAAFTCRTKNGHIFHASPAVTALRRRSLWSERTRLIGKMLTVQYQEMTERGVPRFPVGKAIRGSFVSKSDWL